MDLPPNRKQSPLVDVAWDGPIVQIKFAGPNIGQRETPIIQEDIGPYLKLKTIKFLVLDLSAVPFLDLAEFDELRAVVRAIDLVGASTTVVGLRPGIIMHLIESGADTSGIRAALGLEEALGEGAGSGGA